MAQEIELKFIVAHDGVEALRQHLNSLDAQHTPAGQLLNIYYETADNWLRRHDMGLRIRGDRERYEMTLKIAGRVVGGLHQRPEYNIPLEKAELALDKLPAEVWPQGQLPAELAQNVQPLFSTDFLREKWVVKEGSSQIEIALDLGEVKAGEHQEAICELELELLSGDTADILALAHRLLATGVLRQGSLSKAARGYQLAQSNEARPVKSLTVVGVAAKASVEQGLEAALESALAHWLYHDEVWNQGNAAAKREIQRAMARVRHALVLFGGIVPRKATVLLRESLTEAEAALDGAEKAEAVLFNRATVGTKLLLTEWLVTRGWRSFLNEAGQKKIAGSFKRFADIQLSRAAAELKSNFQQTQDDYSDRLTRLAREIDSIQLLSSAYAGVAEAWLENWQEVRRAIENNDRSVIEYFRRQALAAEPFWLHSGKR
ncbi:CYTH domain-containing protein [Klebsiella aerogenes]|uniref:CYTH domain-containing protein n=1 Tax=Klebsiella aerogenes TaxID=548 RepID=UPI00111739C2|nr:inorganic triphosphatase [Klebsiella aerogenes]ELA0169775.1 inorganic triphosphatase [Klebsiella aerogenes]QEV97228.1 inorganic triphosphatase [Klebsiella aerogenes]